MPHAAGEEGMITCEQCKFWSHEQDGIYPENEYSCSCPKFILGYSEISIRSDEILIEDDEGWGFAPGPKFGCIHGELKEDL